MDLRLAGKRAPVTGSSAGLGEAIAKFLAAEGAVVVVRGRDIGRTNAVAQAIHAAGGSAEIAIGDLSTDGGADTVASAAQAGGGIDILVNNAGAYHHLTWMEATPDRWIESYQSNVVSCVRMIHRLVPGMKERRWGRVIQIGGGLAIQPTIM
jgi:3-oxoacyl-[acyl-carrier protein] reductase